MSKGSLAFDVGANVGDVTSVLLDVGARVVAVEPNLQLADLTRRRYGVTVEGVAVGAAEGEEMFHFGEDPGHSTLSQEWCAIHPEWYSEAVPVPVTTLDRLIERHGKPRFARIHVEGYEANALRGLSEPLQALAFGFQRHLPEVTRECVARLAELGVYRFQFVKNHGYSRGVSELMPDGPRHFEEILVLLDQLYDDAYGDIYAVLQRETPERSDELS